MAIPVITSSFVINIGSLNQQGKVNVEIGSDINKAYFLRTVF
jgi:hypothetical protein